MPERIDPRAHAASNPKVDMDLLGELRRLTAGLPKVSQGAAYSLGEQVPERGIKKSSQLLNQAFARFLSHG